MQAKHYVTALVAAAITCAFIAAGCSPRVPAAPADSAIGTPAWYDDIDRRLNVSVRSGLEVRSTQWLEIVSSLIAVYDHEGHGPNLDSEEWQQCVHSRLFGKLALPNSDEGTDGGVK